MRGLLIAAFACAFIVLFALPAAAFEPIEEEHQDEPCVPDSIFDPSCDEGGGSESTCTENCRVCETRNGRFGCYSTPYAGSCSCWTQWHEDGTLSCNERGRCSVWV